MDLTVDSHVLPSSFYAANTKIFQIFRAMCIPHYPLVKNANDSRIIKFDSYHKVNIKAS